ncbi:RDD family protein [Bartonella sp. HY329]|uniref:RDD family protein n=1 Tax=unclassified Bartonella TaxID=2645622 RepID=UPI0021C5ED81|nr:MULTISPECIES: RDD family protein [unclassified Bartonella]UXM96002.1 RDD family protein [Bartonella sp. HY329]UXN10327.1 RDD family protein [Bartonella sp. HY328]
MSSKKRINPRLWEFIPPEGVPIHFTIATIGSRFAAQIIDFVLIICFTYSLFRFLSLVNLLSWTAGSTLATLVGFFIRTPYYIFSELIWNGRTIGKKLVKIRVININGRRLTPHQIAARNLMKEIEVFVPIELLFLFAFLPLWAEIVTLVWTAIIVIVLFSSRRRQRLGDIIAGTLVVENPTSVLMPDLVVSSGGLNTKSAVFTFLPEQLEIYGRHELQTLEAILRDSNMLQMDEQMRLVTQTIMRKINFQETLRPGQERLFLTEFYKVQREHLEKLRLFGTRRENKFHTSETKK